MAASLSSPAEPVKIVLQRRAAPGAAEAFESWVEELLRSASTHAALEGSSVLQAEGCHFILLRFASQAELERWRSAPAVRALLRRGDELAHEPGEPVVHSGLETWFALPGRAPSAAPPRWKMALVTWLALLPQVLLLGAILPADLPYPFAAMIGTAVPVVLLTWWIMPRLTLLLRRWLYEL